MTVTTKMATLIVSLFAIPVCAQDMPGAMSVTDMGRTMVLTGQNQGYIDRARGKSPSESREVLSPRSRAYCEAFPSYRSRYGAKDARVTRLAAACRRAGYRY
ncbi:hypothetical protein [Sphingomonas sp. Leaf412]|uniref:hypothetical protein n=1 Tax=Sphingomonas sp. Leaf412 TaxID=1736370 RepID=UPI000AD38190|nr:hypothetical protein [Sphingomonas sp. Leaf412]